LPQRTQRGQVATVAARATAEYAEYAKAGRESHSISFPRIWRIPRFNRSGGCGSTQFFAAGEQIGLLQCKEEKADPEELKPELLNRLVRFQVDLLIDLYLPTEI